MLQATAGHLGPRWVFVGLKGSLGTLVRGVPCDLKVTGSNCGIGHWKQVRPSTIHHSGCGPSPNPAYAECFVYRTAFYGICEPHIKNEWQTRSKKEKKRGW